MKRSRHRAKRQHRVRIAEMVSEALLSSTTIVTLRGSDVRPFRAKQRDEEGFRVGRLQSRVIKHLGVPFSQISVEEKYRGNRLVAIYVTRKEPPLPTNS